MEPKLRNEEIFQKLLYTYLKEKGYERTAQLFQTETQLTEPLLGPDAPGFLIEFWSALYAVYNSRPRPHMEQTSHQNLQQPGNTSTQSQVVVQQQPGNSSTQSQQVLVQKQPSNSSKQPLNIGPVINTTTAQIIPFQLHSSFRSGAVKLLSCDISSDGNIVASGGRGANGMKPFICYPETGHSVITRDTHKKAITEVRFQPNFNLFATASFDASIKLWDATTCQTVLRYMVHKELKHKRTVRSLDFHQLDNKTLCSSDDAAIKVWDLNKYTKAINFKEGGRVVRFQPVPGRLLAVANGNGITIYDYHNMLVIKKLQGHRDITSICWDVNGEMIASMSEDEVRVWSVRGGECTHSYPSNGRKFQSVIFHPRHLKTLVIGGSQGLLLLNLETMREYTTPSATELPINGLAATKAPSHFIVSASDDSVVKIWK